MDRSIHGMAARVWRSPVILVFIVVLSATRAFPINFSITPTSLDLDKNIKSGSFSVMNSDKEKLNCQISLKEWSQDSDGKDVYADAKDIIYFPKIMTVEPNEQRAIRIGIKGTQGLKEKTYRLFVEEIPAQKKTETQDANKITAGLTIAFRYSTPIFVKPVKQQESAVIENIQLSKNTARAVVRNTGNIHLKLIGVTFRGRAKDGSELFSKNMGGWYVLHGIARRYETAVPKELCEQLSAIEVSAQSENFAVNGTMNVQTTMCTQ